MSVGVETGVVGRGSREGGAIVNQEEAAALASRGLGVSVDDLELREFEEGWVAWPVVAGTAVGVLPDRIGDARVVVERSTGKVSSWPPLPVEEIIARSHAAPAGRFPEDVETHLRKSGWYPGRSIPDADLDHYAQRLDVLTTDEELRLTLVAPARRFLAEFGGLTIGVAPMKPTTFQPRPTAPDVDSFSFLREDLGELITPIGTIDDPDYPEEIVLSDGGRVFLTNFSGAYLLAETIDWAVVRLVRGRGSALPLVDDEGQVRYIDGIGDPIDPSTTRGPSGAQGLDVPEEAQHPTDQRNDG